MRFDRLAVATAAEGLGVGLEPTLLAERELMTGRLIAPLAGRSTDIRYFGHRLRQRSAVRAFAEWIIAELDVQGNG